jgi:hypothetical protein
MFVPAQYDADDKLSAITRGKYDTKQPVSGYHYGQEDKIRMQEGLTHSEVAVVLGAAESRMASHFV